MPKHQKKKAENPSSGSQPLPLSGDSKDSSADCPPASRLRVLYRSGFVTDAAILFFLSVLFLFPSWTLPWAVIDDALFTSWAADAATSLSRLDVHGAWMTLYPSGLETPNFGPATIIGGLYKYALAGYNPHIFHFFRTFDLFAMLLGMYLIGRVANFGRLPSLLGCFIFILFSPGMILQDFQSYSANWYRLYTTDTYYLIPLVWFLALFLYLLYNPKGYILHALALLIGLLAFTAKINSVVVLPALLPAIALYLYLARPKLKCLIAPGVILIVCWIAGLLFYNVLSGSQGLSGNTSREWNSMKDVLGFHGDLTFDGLGVYPLTILPLGLLLLTRYRDNRRLTAFVAIVSLYFAHLALISIWTIKLPRYLITHIVFLAIAGGWVLGLLINELRARAISYKWSLFTGSLMLSTVLWFGFAYALWIGALSPKAALAIGLVFIAISIIAAFAPSLWDVAGRYCRNETLSQRCHHGTLLYSTATLLGGLLLHLTIGILNHHDFSSNYKQALTSSWRWIDYTSKANGIDENSLTVLLPGKAPEVIYQTQFINDRIYRNDSPLNVRVDLSSEALAESNILVIKRNNVHSAFAPIDPPILNGAAVRYRNVTDQESRRAVAFKSGDSMEFQFGFDRPTLLHGFYLLGDNIVWGSDLDMMVQIRYRGISQVVTVHGSSLPRQRRGSPTVHFPAPILLPEGTPLQVFIKFDSLITRPSTETASQSTAVLFMNPSSGGKFTSAGSILEGIPSIVTIEGPSLEQPYRQVLRTTDRARTIYLSSPYNIYKTWKSTQNIWTKDTARIIDYEFVTEIYEK